MCTAIKNGKLHTINIFSAIILFLFCISLTLSPVSAYGRSGPKNEDKWVIVLDPGHGGRDPGALGSVSKEKDINLAIALKTGKYLEQNMDNVTVIYTRKDDSTVDLYERPTIANKNKADLFISIHANWAESKNVAGAETYVMGLAKDEENLAVAMKENEVILLEEDYSTRYEGFDPKSPESYIIFTLTQNVFQRQSSNLASKIQYQFLEKARRRDRGVRQAGFIVLFKTTMPSVLIETGYLTNQAEEKYLISNEGQDYIASAIYRACRDYINEIDIMSTISTDRTGSGGDKAALNGLSQMTGGKLMFMVQVASSTTRTEIRPENFSGIKNIIEINSGDRFRYATGAFDEYQDAVKYRREIETIRPDAFVIAVKDNKILPLQEALNEKKKK
ncbi:MAG: N-acetylmuramoyl-L-alanine amidase [Bacteroidales bacterium]|nr:N-acetylmuramoyl-L-alanine amidase [Bacteroidales bacterium]